jgi:hypothetical protein
LAADDAQPQKPGFPARKRDPAAHRIEGGDVPRGVAVQQIRGFVAQAARIATARAIAFALFDALLLALATALAAAWVGGWTLRGDLAAPAWLAVTGLAGMALLLVAVTRSWRRFRDRLAAARAIARTPGALSSRPSEAALRRERLLRHEILGALELADGQAEQLRSPELCAAYIDDVATRLRSHRIEAGRALPRPRTKPRVIAMLVLGIATIAAAMSTTAMTGLSLVWTASDGRPPTPPEPVWSTLTLELDYPAHTHRPRRVVPNPSGALRVVAGTEVHVDLVARRPASIARVLVNYDPTELEASPQPDVVELERGEDDATQQHFVGSFTARGAGTWTVILLEGDEADEDESSRRSPAMPLQLEPDRPPEVELLPLPRANQEVSETDTVDIRFHARDDFGLVGGELVYQLPDGVTHRLSTGEPSGPTRTWRHSYAWDISQIPIAERSEVLYWIEVRDNDPGLHIDPLPDPPGKVTRSATMRLLVKDDEAEHAANIVKLAEIRDAAVDLLAERMTTIAFEAEPPSPDPADVPPPLEVRLAAAREVLGGAGSLLAMISTAIDSLSVDTLTHERDVSTLVGVHGRLMKLHRTELSLHEGLPPGVARSRPVEATAGIDRLRPHNEREVAQLEDEIIRLDDLVDGQIVARLEALVARLEATQRKLVELLEQLQAGDESVRAQIDQLEQRRREDLRRIAEARAMLRREVDEEFMNLDAFKLLEEMAQREQLSEMLRRGEVDEAVEQAKGQLGEVQQLRDQVQDKIGKGEQATDAVSEEERKRMQLLRELSRLQDEEGGIRSQTRKLHDEWREGVKAQKADKSSRERAADDAEALRKALEKVNDARLSREGRRGLDDAKEALEKLEQLGGNESASQLDLAEAARKAAEGLERASEGSETREDEGQQLRKAKSRAQALQGAMQQPLPEPGEVLSEEGKARLDELGRRQQGLRKRVDELLGNELSEPLPAPGRKALRGAGGDMQESASELGQKRPEDAVQQQSSAWDELQRAIDSLRRASPPPPSSSASGEASTEAERDRTLRDALMDAMREGAPDGYGEPVKRYYEELLR